MEENLTDNLKLLSLQRRELYHKSGIDNDYWQWWCNDCDNGSENDRKGKNSKDNDNDIVNDGMYDNDNTCNTANDID